MNHPSRKELYDWVVILPCMTDGIYSLFERLIVHIRHGQQVTTNFPAFFHMTVCRGIIRSLF